MALHGGIYDGVDLRATVGQLPASSSSHPITEQLQKLLLLCFFFRCHSVSFQMRRSKCGASLKDFQNMPAEFLGLRDSQ